MLKSFETEGERRKAKGEGTGCLLPLSLLIFMLLLPHCKKEVDPKEKKDRFVREIIDEVSADSLKSDVIWLQNMGTRFALAQNHRNVAVQIRDRFRRMGYASAELDSFIINRTFNNVLYSQWQYNVIAVIEGCLYPDSVCILGGHYDDYSGTNPFASAPGAHDNASGTAAVLEVARVLKKAYFAPSRSIMFIAFSAEELGLYGSNDFVADPGVFLNKISFMLNNDMIAYEPVQNTGAWQVNIMDYATSHSLKNYAAGMASKFTSLKTFTDNTHNSQSDSYPFYTSGYKSIFFFSGKMDPYYHTTNDLVTNCNFEYCREIVKTCSAILADYNYIE